MTQQFRTVDGTIHTAAIAQERNYSELLGQAFIDDRVVTGCGVAATGNMTDETATCAVCLQSARAKAIATAEVIGLFTKPEIASLAGLLGRVAPAMISAEGFFTYTDAQTSRKVCILPR